MAEFTFSMENKLPPDINSVLREELLHGGDLTLFDVGDGLVEDLDNPNEDLRDWIIELSGHVIRNTEENYNMFVSRSKDFDYFNFIQNNYLRWQMADEDGFCEVLPTDLYAIGVLINDIGVVFWDLYRRGQLAVSFNLRIKNIEINTLEIIVTITDEIGNESQSTLNNEQAGITTLPNYTKTPGKFKLS